ncbi:MAG TPA: serine/threonine-protein kinase, partial [Kofleriaceae bacterium]
MAQEPGLEANGDDLVLPQGGRFEILGRLGSGGMGIVYSARDLTTRSRVALKTLRHLDPTALYWFKKEFRSLADLSHPNLVRLDELFCENGQWFFTMEHVEGCDFMRWVREMPTDRRIAYARTLATPVAGVPNPAAYAATQGTPPGRLAQASSAHDDTVATRIAPPSQPAAHPAASASPKQRARASFDESRVRSTLRQIAEGLAVLHAAGKVHRDIKPSNILVRPNGSVVIVDFGLVSEIHSSQQMEDGNIVGTPYYMAPEQALGQTVGPPADWYAVGSILYEVLSGSLPFEGTVTEVLFRKQAADPDPLDALASGIPADLSALCMAMLARDPAARPTAAEVIARLGTSHGARRARTSAPVVTLVPFVGRTTELAQLRNAYAEAVDGKPLTLLVEGESGLGKSALAQQFIVQLDSSALAFSGRCYERESVPYKALDDIVDAISRFLFALDDDEVTQYIPKEIAS